MAAVVLVSILHGGGEEDDAERNEGRFAAEDGELRDLVEESEEEEVYIGDTAELFEEVARDEGED